MRNAKDILNILSLRFSAWHRHAVAKILENTRFATAQAVKKRGATSNMG
jgi:hypothetical protein